MESAGASTAGKSRKRRLSSVLEDYLEIILQLSARQNVVRVRDIARAKAVRMPTVTAALKRLARHRLVDYAAREYVALTPSGQAAAGRVASRHVLLERFLHQILGVPTATAARDACGLEHHLSGPTLERLAAFVEYVQTCPEVGESFLDRFRVAFGQPSTGAQLCPDAPCRKGRGVPRVLHRGARRLEALADLPEGARGELARLHAGREARLGLLDRGLLPGVGIEVVRAGGRTEPTRIRVQGREETVEARLAANIFVERDPVEEKDDAR